MYLSHFYLPEDEHEVYWQHYLATHYAGNDYPFGIFPRKDLRGLAFGKITVLYGSNGCGKSTLLNLIAQKLSLKRIAPFNESELFGLYAENCVAVPAADEDGEAVRIPNGSRIITSDDVFDYMLSARAHNEYHAEKKEEIRNEWASIRWGGTVHYRGPEDYEALRVQNLARRKKQKVTQFTKKMIGEELRLRSNGETALEFFKTELKNDTLYCLDEPENSLSPKMQLELTQTLELLARCCGCQFIIATHSPFLLALNGARVYDLDGYPAGERNWWELENPKIYFEFFKKHAAKFEQQM